MPNNSNYDLSFQPKTYWDLRDVLTHVEAKIPGKVRKELVKHALQNGETVPLEYLESSLSADLKQSIGSIDPSFLGGEFLPELGENDVIIASINLKSTTSDVIAVIARLTDKGIEYRVEDEYMDSYPEVEEHYKVQPNFSKEPLSFKELINLIDNAREESAFYPQLRGWYDEANNEWLEDKLELKRQKEQDKKNTQKSEIPFRLGTQERATQLNNGGATQIVLNRRVRKWEVSPENLKGRSKN